MAKNLPGIGVAVSYQKDINDPEILFYAKMGADAVAIPARLCLASTDLLTFAKATEAFLTNGIDVDASGFDIRSRCQVYAEMLRDGIAKAEGR